MATSYNGWLAVQSGAGIDTSFSAAGVKFPGGVKAGDVATIFRWLIERLNTIEPVVPGWCWGWEYRPNVNNPSTLSCHSSGTAIDYNAPNHPNGARGTWSAAKVSAIRGWLAELGGVVQWGADFTGTKDEMHFEINGSAAQVAAVAARLGREPGKPAAPSRVDSQPATPAPIVEEDDMPYSEQQIKQLVHDGVQWALEDIKGIDPLIIKAAVGAGVDAAVQRIGDIVKAEVAKALPRGVQADPDQHQAAKEIVHDGAKWAIEDPAVDVARFRG